MLVCTGAYQVDSRFSTKAICPKPLSSLPPGYERIASSVNSYLMEFVAQKKLLICVSLSVSYVMQKSTIMPKKAASLL